MKNMCVFTVTTLNIAVLFLLSISANVFAQAPFIQWQKSLGGTVGDYAYCVKQTSDGGYIVAGYTNSTDGDVIGNHSNGSGNGDEDYWIVKLNSTGTIQWQKCLGGTGNDRAHSIYPTSDGGYIVAGESNSTDGDVTGNHGGQDYWIVKLNPTGNIQWQKSLGGTSTEVAYSIQQTSDGGFIIAGYTSSNNVDVTGNHGGVDYWIVKLNTIGNIQWQKSLGGTANDYASSIQQTSDGGYIIAGSSTSNDGDVTGNNGADDYWIVKLNSIGTIQWQKSLGGTASDGGFYSLASIFASEVSVQQTSDGGYIVAGYTNSTDGDVTGNHGGLDYWVVKLSSSGSIQWQKCFGGTSDDVAQSIFQTIDGGYIVAGYTNSTDGDVTGNHGNGDYWIVKINAGGTIQWQKCFGGPGSDGSDYHLMLCIQQTSDGGYVVAGSSNSTTGDVTGNHGGLDYWVVKFAQCSCAGLNTPSYAPRIPRIKK